MPNTDTSRNVMSRIRIAVALLVCVFISLGAPAVAALV